MYTHEDHIRDEREKNAWKDHIPLGTKIKLWGTWFTIARSQQFDNALVLIYEHEHTMATRKRERKRNGR